MAGVDYNALKKGGFIRQVQDDYFSMRLRIAGGHIKADGLKKVYEIAERFCFTLDRVGWDTFKEELENIAVRGG